MFWRRRDDASRNGHSGGTGDTDGMRDDGDDVLEQLSAYLDGELTDAEEAAVEALVARDEAAAELLADLGLMRSAFGALGEVRAPRSFAIPAGASSAPRGSVFLFRRFEVLMRASAAAATLFFVVALVNDPGGETPVTTMASEEAAAFERQGPELEAAQTGAAGDAASMAAASDDGPVPEETMGVMAQPESSGGGTAGSPGTGAATGGTDGTSTGDLPEDASTQDSVPSGEAVPPSTAPGAETSLAGEALQPSPVGTERFQETSEGVGGVAPALGALAGLLTALSALMAWTRRTVHPVR